MKNLNLEREATVGALERPGHPALVSAFAAAFTFYLSVGSIVCLSAARAAPKIERRLSGRITVVVRGAGLESADAAAARAAERLASQASIRRVDVLDTEEDDQTIAEAICERRLGREQPRLLSIDGVPGRLPTISRVRSLLTDDRLDVCLDDHRGLQGPLETRMLVAGGVGFLLAFGLFVALFTFGFLGGVCAISARGRRYDLMTRLGADAGFVATVVGRRIGMMALVGGLGGVLGADLAFLAALGDGVAPLTLLHPMLVDGVWTVIWPLAAAAVAAMAGGIGARRTLVREERDR